MPAAGLEALGIQEIAQHPAAREGKLKMQLVHASHDGEIRAGSANLNRAMSGVSA
jgi:hypothetical protein